MKQYDKITLEFDGGIQTPMHAQLSDSGLYDNELLESSMSVYVPWDPECPYMIYHLISGAYKVVGAKIELQSDDFDEVEHYLLTK